MRSQTVSAMSLLPVSRDGGYGKVSIPARPDPVGASRPLPHDLYDARPVRPERDNIAIPPFPPGTTWIGTEAPVSERLTARAALLVHFFELGELSSVRTLPFVSSLARTYAENGL